MAVFKIPFAVWQQMSEKTRAEMERKFDVEFSDYKYAKPEYVRK